MKKLIIYAAVISMLAIAATGCSDNSSSDIGNSDVISSTPTESTDAPAETTPEEKPAETTPEEKPAETTPEEKPAESTPEEKPAESTPEEKPAESTPEEKPAETTPEEKPAETTPEEKPAETTPEEKPAESEPEEKPAENRATTMGKAAYGAAEWPAMMECNDDETLKLLLNIEADKIEEYYYAYQMMSVHLNEILIVKPAAGCESAIKSAFDARFEYIKNGAAFYPSQEASAAGSVYGVTKDGYYYIIVHAEGSEIEAAMLANS
ncbi:MAG: DUF4358 domain-containing protein [Oscillospiraceae bacterium]